MMSIRIGPFNIRLRTVATSEMAARQLDGCYNPGSQIIELKAEFPTAAKRMEVLLHEHGHAIWDIYGLREGDNEERIICAFGVAWLQVFRDNPWLLEQIKGIEEIDT